MSACVSTKGRMSVRTIVKISILGALTFLVMMFGIPLPSTPDFYELGSDEVIALTGGFTLGPQAVVYIEALKIALDLLIGGTIAMGVGELTNFLIGLSFVFPATITYQRDKTRKHALLGLIIETICMTILGGLLNYFITLSAYSYFMDLPLGRIVEFGRAVNLNTNGLLTLVLMATTPFDVLKGVLYSIVVFLSYKKVPLAIKKQ